jgi:hypothetical protein
MTNELLSIIQQGAEAWNQWRQEQERRTTSRGIRPDLTGADLSNKDLAGISLEDSLLNYSNLSGTNLQSANLFYSELISTDLSGTNLSGANLQSARLIFANLRNSNLRGTDLRAATLVESNLEGADLTGAYVYGTSTWGVRLYNTHQLGLIVTAENEPRITVDNLEIAQFIYLLLNNDRVRDVIDTITSKIVLILGRFTDERKTVLDALRDELRRRNYSPVLFDFTKPKNRDITETVSTLAHMARFVIADITDAKSIPQELGQIVPNLPSVPIQPLLQVLHPEYGMFEHFTRYPWVLPTYCYADEESLVLSLQDKVIDPAEKKVIQLQGRA